MPPIDKKETIELSAETDTNKDEKKNKNSKKKKGEEDTPNISEVDLELKERLETCVNTLLNTQNESTITTDLRLSALDKIVLELRTATSSMTSVPKPLKFLRPFFIPLKDLHKDLLQKSDMEWVLLRARLADVLAVLSMTLGKHEDRESLTFKLSGRKDYISLEQQSNEELRSKIPSDDNLGSWGHEFVRSLTGEIGQEYNARVLAGADPDQDGPFADLLEMVDVIVPFHVNHNAEAEAVDLLMDVQRLKKLLDLESIDERNYRRICNYLVKTSDFQSDPDDLKVRRKVCAEEICFVFSLQNILRFSLYYLALRINQNTCKIIFILIKFTGNA